MKKIGMFLLAVVMMVGAVGMVGCGTDKLEIADMAGTYILTKATFTAGGITETYTPPIVTATLTLTSAGTWSVTSSSPDGVGTDSGTFTVNDPNITFTGGGDTSEGVISNDGKTITSTDTEAGVVTVIEFAKL